MTAKSPSACLVEVDKTGNGTNVEVRYPKAKVLLESPKWTSEYQNVVAICRIAVAHDWNKILSRACSPVLFDFCGSQIMPPSMINCIIYHPVYSDTVETKLEGFSGIRDCTLTGYTNSRYLSCPEEQIVSIHTELGTRSNLAPAMNSQMSHYTYKIRKIFFSLASLCALQSVYAVVPYDSIGLRWQNRLKTLDVPHFMYRLLRLARGIYCDDKQGWTEEDCFCPYKDLEGSNCLSNWSLCTRKRGQESLWKKEIRIIEH